MAWDFNHSSDTFGTNTSYVNEDFSKSSGDISASHDFTIPYEEFPYGTYMIKSTALRVMQVLKIIFIIIIIISLCIYVYIAVTAENERVRAFLILCIFDGANILGLTAIKSYSRVYLKKKVVQKELAKHFIEIKKMSLEEECFEPSSTINFLQVPIKKLMTDVRQDTDISRAVKNQLKVESQMDYIKAECSDVLMRNLDINIMGWNTGIVNNDIRGRYKNLTFRFIDITLKYIKQEGKYIESRKLFGGQAYIFEIKESMPIGMIYDYVLDSDSDSDWSDPDMFFRSFRVSKLDFENNITQAEFDEYRNIIESPSFCINMIKLAKIWRGAFWQLKIINNYIIFTLKREYLNMFELSTMFRISRDIHEFIGVMRCVDDIDLFRGDDI